ncbi:MAG: hypothetical protein WCU80_03990 [Paludibacteraceae bacterium]
MTIKTKLIAGTVVGLSLTLCFLVYFRYYFVFGTGVKSGQLNQIVYKGYVFKTYEGRIIQTGFKGANGNTIQSYEFTFSVDDEAVAKKLERLGGKEVELHYNEYKHALPWRGVSIFVVDSIVSVNEDSGINIIKK